MKKCCCMNTGDNSIITSKTTKRYFYTKCNSYVYKRSLKLIESIGDKRGGFDTSMKSFLDLDLARFKDFRSSTDL